jgi:hypothetical protein
MPRTSNTWRTVLRLCRRHEMTAQSQQVSASFMKDIKRNTPIKKKSIAMRTRPCWLSDKPWVAAACATVALTVTLLPVTPLATGFRTLRVSRRWGTSEDWGCLPLVISQDDAATRNKHRGVPGWSWQLTFSASMLLITRSHVAASFDVQCSDEWWGQFSK